jgi:hypothetical protein
VCRDVIGARGAVIVARGGVIVVRAGVISVFRGVACAVGGLLADSTHPWATQHIAAMSPGCARHSGSG